LVINPRIKFLLLLFFLVLLSPATTGLSAQASLCKPLDTAYHFLATSWRWIAPDTVVFGVDQGGALVDSVAANQWYQYQPAADKLQALETSPFGISDLPAEKLAKLSGLVPWENGLYERVYATPNGSKFVYLHKIDGPITYWFADLENGVQADLGIGPLDDLPTDIFWFPGEQQFIIQNGSNGLIATLWATEASDKLTITRLDQGAPWSDSQAMGGDFVIAGLSPDGRYLLTQPLTGNLWAYDLEKKQQIPLDFTLWGDQHTVWTSTTAFRAITNLGVIEYDLLNQQRSVVGAPDDIQLNNTSSSTTLSPDGKFMLTPRIVNSGPDQRLDVCSLS
jgi:hypothetical protein